MDKLDIPAIRGTWGNNADVLQVLHAIDTLLATPTPMPQSGSEQWACGWDAGWGAFRREARRLFGVGDE